MKSKTTLRILLVAMHLPMGLPKVASLKPAAVEVEESDGSGGDMDQDWAD